MVSPPSEGIVGSSCVISPIMKTPDTAAISTTAAEKTIARVFFPGFILRKPMLFIFSIIFTFKMSLGHFKNQSRHLTGKSCLSYLLLIDTYCQVK